MARFLAWLDREAPGGKLTEIDAVEALESFRRDTGKLKDVSFPTIAGAGPNGAIVHYRVTRASNRRIGANELFLVDSGAQYEDGTTDITRTVIVGTPSDEMRDRFTRVLKGHIAIATRGVSRRHQRRAARSAWRGVSLWQAGLDFDHGTGHGVGSYLSVHEGPARISKLGTVALKRGMILSNEPGYYKTGAYGIRIENLVLVIAAPEPAGAEKPLNAFETLTLAPIDRRLIEHEHAHRQGTRLARRLSRARARGNFRRWSMRRRGRGSRRRHGRCDGTPFRREADVRLNLESRHSTAAAQYPRSADSGLMREQHGRRKCTTAAR